MSAAFDQAKAKRRELEKGVKALRKILDDFTGDETEEYLQSKERWREANKELTDYKVTFSAAFKTELERERLSRIRSGNGIDRRTSVQQHQLFTELTQATTHADLATQRRQTGVAFSASGLVSGQTASIWGRPVTIIAPFSKSQVKVLNLYKSGHAFESIDRYEAIQEARHAAIAAALRRDEKEHAPPPPPETTAPAPAETQPVLNFI